MRLGIDILLNEQRDLIKGKKLGFLANAASVTSSCEHATNVIMADSEFKLTALFGPEHGILTNAQDMERVDSQTHASCGIPIYSLYGSTLDSLKPTSQMLDNIDTLVIDLQDIGSRYYTYIWTALLCIEACAEAGKEIIVCDRPNPIGGQIVEGLGIEQGFESFVGLSSLPVRHGMTLGEIVQCLNIREHIDCRLKVIQMNGWKRDMNWPDTGLKWVNPSPNMRSYTAALLYPGMCLVEGTNISEGRGTDTPFEIVGAPFFDSEDFIKAFEALKLHGVRAAPTSFIPIRQKWTAKLCHGVRFIVTDALKFRPYLTGLAFVWLAHKLYGNSGFEWRTDAYEFVKDRPAIDLLTGSSQFRETIKSHTMQTLVKMAQTPDEIIRERKKLLFY